MAISTLLIANRGEIAVRIIRTAKELGIKTVQVHSEADADSLAVRMADSAVDIGPANASKSYLNIPAILEAAQLQNADAIHPGYGFLAENAEFAEAVTSAGMTFVGPTAETIRQMGDKSAARQAAKNVGVPVVPGSDRISNDSDFGLKQALEIGFPIMIKASAGGGGRGIRIAKNREEFLTMAPQAATEAKSAFGDDTLYLEKVVEKAHHIEVQILGDGKNHIHCFDRECSLQRRRQKVWEEAPSPILDSNTRESICDSAVKLAANVNYRSAGTVEFLYDEETGDHFFIEMNTRIQVEHPVTEAVTGLDLIKEMLLIGGGEMLSHQQEDIKIDGHSIEVRINAEDPANNFMPFPGRVENLSIPNGPGVRFDHMLYDGYQIPPYYDSLLGKLIVHAPSRSQAISLLSNSIMELKIGGLATTTPLFQELSRDSDVLSGNVHTNWLEHWLKSNASKLAQS